MKNLTTKSKEKYLKDTFKCPFCKSANIMGEHFEADYNQAWRTILCGRCGKRWNEIFTMTDIEEIK